MERCCNYDFCKIRELEKYSCPDIKNNSLTAIKLPWVFKVKSYPGNLIKINHAALESVQPTYQEPYMKGYPMRAELTLNFKDMSPLYKRTLEEGGVIKVL